ncbi:hypothetical protein Mapa_001626 [Marchantia paleacea]|nr:hypothetical protein Mapa_001626 [Marchantia paleacea]
MGLVEGRSRVRRVTSFIIVGLLIVMLCSVKTVGGGSLTKKSKVLSLAYGYNPAQNGSFALNNVLLPEQYLRGWDGWGVYLSRDCVIRLAQKKEEIFQNPVWIHGPGLKNDSAKDCYALLADDGDFNLYHSDGTLASHIIPHPWALEGVSSRVGYELMFIKDSLEWHHHMILELRHYNWKVPHVTLWQDLLSIVD